tara:strand:+ start:2462 stop:2719 length:258 start_codon:yes stop_codon:yes gene_type:complete
MNKIEKIQDIIQDIYVLEDKIKALKIDKISDSNEFYDFCWVAVMLKDEEEKLQKKEEEKNACNLMGLENEQLNIKAEKIIKKIFS